MNLGSALKPGLHRHTPLVHTVSGMESAHAQGVVFKRSSTTLKQKFEVVGEEEEEEAFLELKFPGQGSLMRRTVKRIGVTRVRD